MVTVTRRQLSWLVSLGCSSSLASAWIVPSKTTSQYGRRTTTSRLDMASIGIFFGTSTGGTQTAADAIYECFGSDVAAEPVDVETIEGDIADAFTAHDALVVGTPTWNTGADTERSGTGWDELYYDKMPALKDALTGKKVAVFGLGDQISYAENYADATGELFDVFEGLGCTMLGAWPMDGYEHEDSKSIRGDKFCGLLLDMVNQEELTGERVEQWVAQLKNEGILEGGVGGVAAVAAPPAAVPAPVAAAEPTPAPAPVSSSIEERLAELERENAALKQALKDSESASAAGATAAPDGFVPHYNAVTGKTMWVSPDGRKSYVS